jgi:hypothetical protein
LLLLCDLAQPLLLLPVPAEQLPAVHTVAR